MKIWLEIRPYVGGKFVRICCDAEKLVDNHILSIYDNGNTFIYPYYFSEVATEGMEIE